MSLCHDKNIYPVHPGKEVKREHEGRYCWCNPTPYFVDEDGTGIYVHHDSPQDRRMPPAKVLVTAISLYVSEGALIDE